MRMCQMRMSKRMGQKLMELQGKTDKSTTRVGRIQHPPIRSGHMRQGEISENMAELNSIIKKNGYNCYLLDCLL